MTLDEFTEHDKMIEAKGIQFVMDPFAASMIEEIHIQYDEQMDDFSVRVPNGPQSSC